MTDVALAAIDEQTLGDLLRVGMEEATADEVTPPLTPGPAWTEERRRWFLDFHRARRNQLDGPAAETTWAVTLDGRPVGAVRLKRTADPATLETGIWLARSARGRGVGTAAIGLVAAKARDAGAHAVVADTAAGNPAAQAAMRRAGFELAPLGRDDRVHGTLAVSASPEPRGTSLPR